MCEWNTGRQRETNLCPVAMPVGKIELSDQYQYLGNCPPTPPLNQQQSIDNKLRLMLD